MWGTVLVAVAGRGLNADDLRMAAVCWPVLQCGPACSSSSAAAMDMQSLCTSTLLKVRPVQQVPQCADTRSVVAV